VMRRDSIEFESDELNTLSLDWEDVKELRTPHSQTVLLDDREVVVGTVLVRGASIYVAGQVLARERVRAIVPGENAHAGLWRGKVSFGASLRSGNTNQTELNSYLFARRLSTFTRFDSEYVGAFGKLGGEENVNNHRLTSKLDVFLTRRFYVTPFAIEAQRDLFQNLAVRVTPGAGCGYHVIDEAKLTWDVEIGAGYRYTRQVSAAAGESIDDGTAAGRVGTSLEFDVTSDIEIDADYSLQFGIPDTADAYHHARLALSVELWKDADLDVALLWDRVDRPRADSNGVVPEKDDFRLTVGLAFDF